MTNLNKRKSTINVGVDVGKWFLDIHIYEKNIHWQDENSPSGIKHILKRLPYYHVRKIKGTLPFTLICLLHLVSCQE